MRGGGLKGNKKNNIVVLMEKKKQDERMLVYLFELLLQLHVASLDPSHDISTYL
jgi:hypothetical protein